MFMSQYILRYNNINAADIGEVGGKNASLGEMFNHLSSKGINVPDGFEKTSAAMLYRLKILPGYLLGFRSAQMTLPS